MMKRKVFIFAVGLFMILSLSQRLHAWTIIDGDQTWIPDGFDIYQLSLSNNTESLFITMEYVDNIFTPTGGPFAAIGLDVTQDSYYDWNDLFSPEPEDRLIVVYYNSITNADTIVIYDGNGNILSVSPPCPRGICVNGNTLQFLVSLSDLGLEEDIVFNVAAASITSDEELMDLVPANNDPENPNPPFPDGHMITYDSTQPTSAELVSSKAILTPLGILIQWDAGTEFNNLGFNIYRINPNTGYLTRINKNIILGQVGSHLGERYNFLDPAGTSKSLYLIEDIDVYGSMTYHPIIPVRKDKPVFLKPRKDLLKVQWANLKNRILNYFEVISNSNLKQSKGDLKVRVGIHKKGIYRISYEELNALGVPLNTLHRNKFRLTYQGKMVPILVKNKKYIEFYADFSSSRYSKKAIYILSFLPPYSPRIPFRYLSSRVDSKPEKVFLDTQHFEENHHYLVSSPISDHFFWSFILSESKIESKPKRLVLSLPDYAEGEIILRMEFMGVTSWKEVNPDHHVQIYLKDRRLYEFSFDGVRKYEFKIRFRPNLRDSRFLELGIRTVAKGEVKYDGVLLNWIEVTYLRKTVAQDDRLIFWTKPKKSYSIGRFTSPWIKLYDITNPKRPVRVYGFKVQRRRGSYFIRFKERFTQGFRRYFVIRDDFVFSPSELSIARERGLRDKRNKADYLIITHRAFQRAIEPLAEFRKKQGFQVMIVDIEEIFNEFGYGEHHPKWIRKFLLFARNNWEISPQYVLLVGGATFDPADYLNTGKVDYIPTYLYINEDPLMESASDSWFVIEDNVPWCAIGRLPVSSVEEASWVVQKIIEYEKTHNRGFFNARALFVADNRLPSFRFYSEDLIEKVLPEYVLPLRVYIEESIDPRAEILEVISSGVNIINYIGHGLQRGWTNNIFTSDDASRLRNRHLFFLISMTCYDGMFTDPYGSAFAWEMTRSLGGAIAAFSPSTVVRFGRHRVLNQVVLEEIYSGEWTTIGQAILEAKRRLSEDPTYRDIIYIYNLIGDPATSLFIEEPIDISQPWSVKLKMFIFF